MPRKENTTAQSRSMSGASEAYVLNPGSVCPNCGDTRRAQYDPSQATQTTRMSVVRNKILTMDRYRGDMTFPLHLTMQGYPPKVWKVTLKNETKLLRQNMHY